jgi:hypothetical protein
MTNYRLYMCEDHDKPQLHYCFDCGAPLVEEEVEGEKTLTCSRMWVHMRVFLRPHKGDLEEDSCEPKVIE